MQVVNTETDHPSVGTSNHTTAIWKVTDKSAVSDVNKSGNKCPVSVSVVIRCVTLCSQLTLISFIQTIVRLHYECRILFVVNMRQLSLPFPIYVRKLLSTYDKSLNYYMTVLVRVLHGLLHNCASSSVIWTTT